MTQRKKKPAVAGHGSDKEGGLADKLASFDYGEGFDALLRVITAQDQNDQASVINPRIIGWVRSPLCRKNDSAAWGREGPSATLEIAPDYVEALDSLLPGQKILLLSWMHLADRNTLHLQGKQGEERRGVFGSRSQSRPNPIGIHETTIVDIERHAATALVRVNALDALDGTPLLDIKGYSWSGDGSDEELILRAQVELSDLGRKAHQCGLLSGASGNLSRRLDESFVITRGGTIKRALGRDDFAMLRLADGSAISGGKPSSEYRMHQAVYQNSPAAAILHSHPPRLLALSLKLPGLDFAGLLDLPLVEAEALRGRLGDSGQHPYGSEALAEAVGRVAGAGKRAVWMKNHGLCVWGSSCAEVLALSEELEQLAWIRLLSGL